MRWNLESSGNVPESPENTTDNTVRSPEFEAHKWKPGQSGNPGGRPKKTLLTEMTAELLEEIASDPVQRQVFKDAVKQKLLAKGVVSAMTLDKLWERHEGKVVQPVQVDGEIELKLSERMQKARERTQK